MPERRNSRRGLRPFVEAGGKAVLLGVRFNRASCLHVGDGRADPAPEIGRLFVPPPQVQVDYPVDTWWIGYDARCPGEEFDNSGILHEEADNHGLLIHTRIGECHAIAFTTGPVVDLAAQLRQDDPYRLTGVTPGTLT